MDFRTLLVDTHAHMPPPQILAGISGEDAMRRFPGVSHSIADVLAHMTFWQAWFVKRLKGEPEPFVTSASVGWPAVDLEGWDAVREQFLTGLEDAASLASQPDLLDARIAPALEFPPIANYTARDALIHVANHNSHHFGQIITLRQLGGIWPPPNGSWTW